MWYIHGKKLVSYLFEQLTATQMNLLSTVFVCWSETKIYEEYKSGKTPGIDLVGLITWQKMELLQIFLKTV